MFSGIVTGMKLIERVDVKPGKRVLTINLQEKISSLQLGDSVAINGVCLTVTDIEQQNVVFDVVPQTLSVTTLGQLVDNDPVNIEYALTYGAAVGGHMVQGHVDSTLLIEKIKVNGDEWQVHFQLPKAYKKWVIEKGFVCIDGMSLTIQSVDADSFMVALIPHTRATTLAKYYQEGSSVNFEVEMMAKYISRYLEHKDE